MLTNEALDGLFKAGNSLYLAKEFMAITKKKIIDTINAMPEEEFDDIDVLLERMMMLEKIEKAEKNIVSGKTYTTEEAKQYLAQWLY